MGTKRRKIPGNVFSFLSSLIVSLSLTISVIEAVSSGESLSFPEASYYIHFLNDLERGKAFMQKCCQPWEMLNSDGDCITGNFQLEKMGTINLERRIRRDTGSNPNAASSNQGTTATASFMRFIGKRQHCPSQRKQLSYNIHSSSALPFSTNLEFVTRAENQDDETSFLILNSRDYCIDWLAVDTIAVQFCVPETCQPTSLPDYSTTSSSSNPTGNFLKVSEEVEMRSNSSSNTNAPTPPSSPRPLCLRKCCPPSKLINMTTFTCVQDDIPWQLYPSPSMTSPSHRDKNSDPSWNFSQRDDDDDDASIPLAITWLTGTPDCLHSYEVYTDKYDSYHINSEGYLITVQNGSVSRTPPGEYCFEAVTASQDDDDPASKPTIISRQMAVVCFEEKDDDGDWADGGSSGSLENGKSWRTLYTLLTGISCLFLFITCVVYGLLWKDLNLPGWLQFAYAFSLLLTFLLLTVAQLWTQQIHDISKNLCRALGYGLHFFFLSCFFFLTSMNLDLWLSFRNTVLLRGFGKGRGKRRFLEFTLFSVGFPAAITLNLLAADNCSQHDENDDGTTSPKSSFCLLPSSGIGENSCVIDSRHKVAQLHYFYGFVGILLLINLVIFVCTLISLRNRERETRIAKQQSTSNSDYDRLQLFTRLFLIMGVLWIFEVISWMFEYIYGADNVQKIFIFTDCLNASQGVAVFLMFVWKKQTWKQLKKKFKSIVGMRKKRPLSRPNYACTVSSGQNMNDMSTKSSHLSSTKSSDSSRIPSTSTTFSQLDFDR